MNISLPLELESFVKAQVASGVYHNATEVVQDSLRLMIKEQSEHVRAAVDQGWAQAEQGNLVSAEAAHQFLKTHIQARAKRAV